MPIKIKTVMATFFLSTSVVTVNAGVCNIIPGSVTCGKGTINKLSGYGVTAVHGTTVLGSTSINGTLSAEDASFSSLDVNGSVKLTQCTINEEANIRGSLTASSSKFEKILEVHSNVTRFINSKVNGDLHMGETSSKKQVVYLDNYSEVTGNIIFEDGNGEVILRGKSKIGGKVVGGKITVE